MYTRSDIGFVAQQLLLELQSARVLALSGELGTGKTTLVRALLRLFGVTEPVSSPTYTYVNVYQGSGPFKRVYHFDLYRLQEPSSFFEMGFDEYLYDEQSLVIIEWPELIKHFLPEQRLFVTLQHHTQDARLITVSCQKGKSEIIT